MLASGKTKLLLGLMKSVRIVEYTIF